MTHNHNHEEKYGMTIGGAEHRALMDKQQNKPKQLTLPAIETVALPTKAHTENFVLRVAHLMKFEVGQSIPVEKRTEWAYTVQEVQKETGRKYRFVRTIDGLRLERKA